MALSLAYRGAAALLAALKPALEEASIQLASEPMSSDCALTFFTTQRELEDAYFGSEGLIATMAPGSLLIDLSPTTPSFARDVNAMATVSDLAMVTAPLVLRDLAASAPFAPENVMLFVAGEEDGLKRAMPILALLSSTIEVRRNAVDAQVSRAMINLQTTALTLAAVESMALARHCAQTTGGLASEKLEAVSELEASMLEAIAHEAFASAFTIEMMMAQLAATLETADEADLILPQAEAAQHLMELLAIIGGIDKAPATLSLVYDSEEAAKRQGLDWSKAEAFDVERHDGDDENEDESEDDDEDDYPMIFGFEEDESESYRDFDGPDPFGYSSN